MSLSARDMKRKCNIFKLVLLQDNNDYGFFDNETMVAKKNNYLNVNCAL